MLELFHATTLDQLKKGLGTARTLVTVVAIVVVAAALFVPTFLPQETWAWAVAGIGVVIGLLLVWRMEVFRWKIRQAPHDPPGSAMPADPDPTGDNGSVMQLHG